MVTIVRFSDLRTPAQLANFLDCSQRTARNYCKGGLIPAYQTRGGHWRIKLPLPRNITRALLAELKNHDLAHYAHHAARLLGDSRLYRKLLDAALIAEPLRDNRGRLDPKIAKHLMTRSGREFDHLLLIASVSSLTRESRARTTTNLARHLRMSRDTLYRRFKKKAIQDALHGRLKV